jgi:hypothetical protein
MPPFRNANRRQTAPVPETMPSISGTARPNRRASQIATAASGAMKKPIEAAPSKEKTASAPASTQAANTSHPCRRIGPPTEF